MTVTAPLSQRYSPAWSLALLAFAQLIISLDINIVFVALPEIGSGLGISAQDLQWVVSAYTVFCGGFLLLGGRAADVLGQRRTFIIALWLYGLSSLLGGLAWRPEVIVAARAVQGIGGALLFPATLSLINRLFVEGAPRNRAVAIWGGAGASGLTLGSLAGGLLTQAFGWPAVFFVNVLLAGIAIVAALRIIPLDERRQEKRSFDLPGAITVTTGVTLLVYALAQGPVAGWRASSVLAAMLLAIASLLAFIGIERRSRDPLMPVRLFRNRQLMTGMLITFLYMGTFGALPYFLTVLFQSVLGYNALLTGLAFVVPSIAICAGTQGGARLANRLGTRATLIVGCITGIVGTLTMAPVTSSHTDYWIIVPGLVIAGIGQGIVWTAMWIAASAGVAHHDQGIASGMASTTLNIGNAIGLAVLVAMTHTGAVDGNSGTLAVSSSHAFYWVAVGIGLTLGVAYSLPRGAAHNGADRSAA